MAKGKPGTGKWAGKNAYYRLSKAGRQKLGPPTAANFAKLVREKAAERALRKKLTGSKPRVKESKATKATTKPVKKTKAA